MRIHTRERLRRVLAHERLGVVERARARRARVPPGPDPKLQQSIPESMYVYIQREEPSMSVSHSRTFRSGNSEALRLPRDVAFGVDVELVLVRSGDVLTAYPAASTIPEMVARLRALPTPPAIEVRDTDELPERPGL